MARERYLVGVDPSELQEKEKVDLPMTPKQKMVKFWYNYQWAIIFVAIVVVLAVVVGVLIGTREKVDYTLVLCTNGVLADTAVDELKGDLEMVAEDVDGNGDINIRIIPLNMLDAGDTVELSTLFSSGNAVMFAMEPKVYQTWIADEETENEYYFTPLNAEHEGLPDHKRYWNWNGSLFDEYASGTFPDDLYFGVRRPIGTASGKEDACAACVSLLERFIERNMVV